MHTRFPEPILKLPISQLGLSEEFSLVCELAGFHTAGELLERHTSELIKVPGFSYHLLGEYIEFLETHHLCHYLDME
ncbi:hypothetical protein [Mucilaginibacter sp. L196]|uniref:hypothetical protein n=1 Tax=Mucilaginibacter sp. L196 TaxID=1641870 RepID=UPI001C2040E3|nr:hypothetical protein [Mucilaginibacter sp. L196]